jgi:ATP-dependent 26S proteasome regulatory subunit
LEALDNFVIMATTNHAELIDDALKNRPSRFDRRIIIDLPDEKLREKMFVNFLKEKRVSLTQIQIHELSSKSFTHGFSGAAIKEAIITAKMYALEDKQTPMFEHIKSAITFIRAQYYDNEKISSKTDSVGFRNRG